jgi:hypothetical protein
MATTLEPVAPTVTVPAGADLILQDVVTSPAELRALLGEPSEREMIQDQIRPADRSEEEHVRIVAEALVRERQSYACLY